RSAARWRRGPAVTNGWARIRSRVHVAHRGGEHALASSRCRPTLRPRQGGMMATGAITQAAERRIGRLTLPRPNWMVVVALIAPVIIVGLLVLVAWTSVRENVTSTALTFRHYVNLYTDPFAYSSFLNTIGFTAVTLCVALALGVPIAWLVERTDL